MFAAQDRGWQRLAQQFHRMLRDVAPVTCLEILLALQHGELDSTELARGLGREISQISQYLHDLHALGLVGSRHLGRRHVHWITRQVTVRQERTEIEVQIRFLGGAGVSARLEANLSAVQDRGWQNLAQRVHDMLRDVIPVTCLEILLALQHGELDSTELARGLDREMSQVSLCLHELRELGLVGIRQIGRRHVHRVTSQVTFRMESTEIVVLIRVPDGAVELRADPRSEVMIEGKIAPAATPIRVGHAPPAR